MQEILNRAFDTAAKWITGAIAILIVFGIGVILRELFALGAEKVALIVSLLFMCAAIPYMIGLVVLSVMD